ncbi:MAG: hypothetical protein SWZ49_18170 [Cyanobacteriota bacterium]|nr:hypothetical protein [Cyanobacteriota bacterium]
MIEPTIKISGAAFNGNTVMATRPFSHIPGRTRTNYVSLTEWCSRNFISKKVGTSLIKKKLLIGLRRHHVWWVCANPNCLEELLEYLGINELFFDANN